MDSPAMTREERLALLDERWRKWAETATTDTPPDRYIGETMPDGTIADRYWWDDGNGGLTETPPDSGAAPVD